jgi:hypothetical protein
MRWRHLLDPTRRQLIVFVGLTILGWGLLAATVICWDGIDAQGNLVGACEPIGGSVSWLLVVPGAYLLAALIVRRRDTRGD